MNAKFTATIGLLLVVLLVPWNVYGTAVPRQQGPNILLMMVDDMGWSDLGCYGGEIDTPNLDRLAYRGLRFSQFYNTAKCAQTRASLLSGLYHDEVGIGRMQNCWTLAEALKQAGYFTIMTGKWHLSQEPTDRGFDRYFGHLNGATNCFLGNETFRLNGRKFVVPSTGFYTTDANTDYAVQFINEAQQAGKPFFCYIAFNAPHYPLQAPKEDVEKYLGRYSIGWDRLRQQRYTRQKELGILARNWPLSSRPTDVRPWASLSAVEQQQEDLRMAAFAAMVDRVDQNVGKLIAHLNRLGVLRDTLILFLSDNGGCPFERTKDRAKMPWDPASFWTYDQGWAHACNTPFRWYKRNQHEGGISTPLIVHWPNGLDTKPGVITHEVGHLVDIMPTLLDLTDTPYPTHFRGQELKPLRGRSLLPIFAGHERTPHQVLYFDWSNTHHAVRIGKWKLVSVGRNPWELYDMEADRTELRNLAEEYPVKAKAMQQSWAEWADEVGVTRRNAARRRSKMGKPNGSTTRRTKSAW